MDERCEPGSAISFSKINMKLLDLTNRCFGRLTVLSRAGNRSNVASWNCQCDCGNETVTLAQNLRSGGTRSCGCLSREVTAKRSLRHGHASGGHVSLTYRVWSGIHTRCYNQTSRNFRYYGGRGIQMCVRWHRSNPNGFSNFLADMGEKPQGLSIDRVNNDWSYMPGNCRWATSKEQRNNQRQRGKYICKSKVS